MPRKYIAVRSNREDSRVALFERNPLHPVDTSRSASDVHADVFAEDIENEVFVAGDRVTVVYPTATVIEKLGTRELTKVETDIDFEPPADLTDIDLDARCEAALNRAGIYTLHQFAETSQTELRALLVNFDLDVGHLHRRAKRILEEQQASP